MAGTQGNSFFCLIAGTIAAFCAATVAQADFDYGNSLQLSDSGLGNHLRIETPARHGSASASGNYLHLNIGGDQNGGFGSGWNLTPMFSGFAAPGILSQAGQGNGIVLDVTGTGNLFSATQSGRANHLAGTIIGLGNAAAISQVGQGNMVSFTQVGTGNTLAISQASW